MVIGDLLLLAWATVCLFVPGITVLAALRRFGAATVIAGGPPVTIGLLYLTALVTGVSGLRFGVVAALLAWLIALVPAVLLGRRGAAGPLPPPIRLTAVRVVGLLATGIAVALGLKTWLRGLGSLSTAPQEHDMILHTELVALIMRTGRAAPWQSFPADVLTGSPDSFYPNGFHLYAAVVGALAGNPVRALNAAMVVLFVVAMPLGVAALGLRLRPHRVAPIAGGAAAMVAAVSYHPLVQLLHDGGVLSNAAAFALAPAVMTVLLAGARAGLAGVAPIALAVCAAVVVHPTSIGTVGWTAAVWILIDALVARDRWRVLRRLVGTLAAGAAVAAVVLVPFLVVAQTQAARVAAEPRDVPVRGFAEALRLAVTAPYGGYLDPTFATSQRWIFVLTVLGVVVCLGYRANAAIVGNLVVWTGLVAGFLAGVQFAPVRITANLYYNGYSRLVGGLAIAQWLVCGAAVAGVVAVLVRGVGLVLRREPWQWLAPLAAAVAVLGLVVPFLTYANVNEDAVARRYRAPEFVRVDGNDLAAARYVLHRISPGDRVMNNANDGSTYGYVYYGLPIVEVAAIGVPGADSVYTYDLLTRFDELGRDARITDLVCRLRIGWAIVDSEAPTIGAPPSLFAGGSYTLAPGLAHLDATPDVSRAARFGDVTVYRVDRSALGCAGDQP